MRAVVLISGSGSNLQAIIDQVKDGKLDLDIRLVISNKPNAYGLERAERAGIDQQTIDHKRFDSRNAFDRELIKVIDQTKPELIILAGFMRILTTEFVEHYQNKLINIHPSLLPKYPGTNTHERALKARDQWHGASIHFVVPEVDAGPVILQGRIKIGADDTPASLQQRIHKIEHIIYPQAIDWYVKNRLSIKGDEVLLDDETHELQLQTFDL